MRALAFDTASTQMTLAVGEIDMGGEHATLLAARQVDAPRQANQVLLAQVKCLLEEAQLSISDINAIVTGRGPGSFTGVRIGVATAKGLACGLGCPLYGASTLDAIAWRNWHAGIRGKLGVVADAMRKEVYPVRYMLDDAGVVRLDEDSVAKPADVAHVWTQAGEHLLLAGDGLQKYAEYFDDSLFELVPQELWLSDGQGLFSTFVHAYKNREAGSGDAAELVPVYTRMSDAEEGELERLAQMTDPHDAQRRARMQAEIDRDDREMRVTQPKTQDMAAGTSARDENDKPFILAIESSCDETAAAVIDGNRTVLADCIASQIDFHQRFGGVVPEIASRKHTEAIVPTVMYTMQAAGLRFDDLAAVSCTIGPGLVGALVVGVAFSKGLCFATGLPFIGVNHLEGHLYANRCVDPTLEPPFVALLVSGGHTMLVHVKAWGNYDVLGSTLDDAVGEAFDKVAKALELGYPGGPVLSEFAKQGDARAINFPRAMMHSGDLQFSLSGLKTAVITYINEQNKAGMSINIPNLAASFTAAVIDVLVAKTLMACKQSDVKTLCIGGGVAANPDLRKALLEELGKRNIRVIMPELSDCADNASMIASVGLDLFKDGYSTPLDADPVAHLSLRTS